jgi:hypothetical protein
MDAGMAVSGRRAFVKNPTVICRALLDALFKNFMFFPEAKDFPVNFGEVEGFEFAVHLEIFSF